MSRLFQTPEERATGLENSRQKFFEDSRFDPEDQRYGLFSFPGPLAISDNSIGQHHIPERDENNLVKLGPRSITATGYKTGKTNDAYIDKKPVYLHEGDKYVDQVKLKQRYQMQRAQTARRVHDHAWKSGGKLRQPYLPYEYMPQNVHVPIRRRIAAGEVRTARPQVNTSPAKKGHPNCYPKTTLAPQDEHLPDEYDRMKVKLAKEAREHKAQMQEQPFRLNNHGGRPFNNDKNTFGYEGNPLPAKKARPTTAPLGSVKHDQPFKPNHFGKSGITDKTIAKFPEYIEDKPREVRRVRQEGERPPAWKTTYKGLTRPTSSVVGNSRNIRREAFRSFRRL